MSEGLNFAAAVAVASIASAVCLLDVGRFRPQWLAEQGNRACIAAVVVGGIGGYAVLGVWPRWPPANALDRFLIVVLPATVVLLLIGRWPAKAPALRWGLGFALAVVAVRILLHQSVYLQDDASEVSLLLLGSAGLLVGVHGLLARLRARRQPVVPIQHVVQIQHGDGRRRASLPLALAASLLVAGLLIAMAGYVKGGTAAFPWSAAITGATIGGCLRGKDTNLQGLIALSVVLLFGFLFIGRFFGGLTTGTALLVLLTPLLCWTSELPLLSKCPPSIRDLVGLALVGVSLLAILLWAKQTFDREMAPLISQLVTRVEGESVAPPIATLCPVSPVVQSAATSW